MSTKPQEEPGLNQAPQERHDGAPTVPGTYEAIEAGVEDDRDTLRAPPRQDETPVVVPTLSTPAFRSAVGQVVAPPPIGLPPPAPSARVAPPPLPLARLALVARPLDALGPRPAGAVPPPLPSARISLPLPQAAPPASPELSLDGDTARAPSPAALSADDSDDIPTLQPDAMDEAERAASDATAIAAADGPQLNTRDIHIPPLPVPKDLPRLLELERGGVETVRPSRSERSAPTLASSLSPAERAARTRAPGHEPRGSRRRMVAGLWIAAAGVAAIGASALWQPVAEPIVPRRSLAAAARAASEAAPSLPAPLPAAIPAPAPAPAAEAAPTPVPASAPAPVAEPALARPEQPAASEAVLSPRPTPVARAFAGVRLRKPSAPAIDPASLPESPSRKAVIDAMTPLREEITRCSAGRGGVAEIMLTVDASGAVRHASLVGDYAGTAQGSCIALAARKARFAPFRQERFSVRYPMTL